MPTIIEVKPVREIRSAQEISGRTGGFIVKDGNVPWKIQYQQGAILWARCPRTPRRYKIHEALGVLVWARDLARIESRRFLTTPSA